MMCGLVAYDLAGKQLWTYELPAAKTSFDFGSWTSPLLAEGLVTAVSSEKEWDDFELSYFQKVCPAAESNPTDPAVAARLARGQRWREGYLRWGRATMGTRRTTMSRA